MARFIVAPGRAITFNSDQENETTYREGEVVDITKKQAEPYVEEGTLYAEGDSPPKPVLGPKEIDPETGLLASGEATADTPAHLLAPTEQVGPLRETFVPGEEPTDLAHPAPSSTADPTVDDLTPEEIAAFTPEELREPGIEPEAVDDETGEPIEDVTEVDTPVETVQEDTPNEPEDH